MKYTLEIDVDNLETDEENEKYSFDYIVILDDRVILEDTYLGDFDEFEYEDITSFKTYLEEKGCLENVIELIYDELVPDVDIIED